LCDPHGECGAEATSSLVNARDRCDSTVFSLTNSRAVIWFVGESAGHEIAHVAFTPAQRSDPGADDTRPAATQAAALPAQLAGGLRCGTARPAGVGRPRGPIRSTLAQPPR
jgi:hypothetical protein